MHRKITTKTVKLSFDIQNQHHMPTSEISCTFFCEMNKTSEYLTFENDNKKTCLIIFFLPFHSKLLQCYGGKSTSLGSWMPSSFYVLNYLIIIIKRPLKHNPII